MSEENHQRSLQEPVLVLNATYEPINVTAVRRALVLILKGVATAEEDDGSFIHAARVAIRIPSVIRLLEFRRIPYQTRALSERTCCCATVTLASSVAVPCLHMNLPWIT